MKGTTPTNPSQDGGGFEKRKNESKACELVMKRIYDVAGERREIGNENI